MKGLICSSHHMGAFVWDLRFQEGSRWSFYERISIGNIGNLQNLTQMLTYNRLIFISFPGWSSKGAWSWWSWWLIPLVLLFIRGRSSIPPPCWHHLLLQFPLIKDLVWRCPSKICEWMEVENSSDVKFSKLSPRGIEARSWGNIGAFKYVRSQSAAEIFLAPDHTGGIHNTSVMQCLWMNSLAITFITFTNFVVAN